MGKSGLTISNQLLVSALEQSSSGTELVGLDVRILWVNSAFCALTGYDFDELLGASPKLFRPRDAELAPYQEMEASIRSGKPWTGELQRRRKDGSVYDCRLSVATVRDSAGEALGYVGHHEDITERKLSEALRREAERSLRALVEAVPDIVLVHAAGQLLLANATATKLARRNAPGAATDPYLLRLLRCVGEAEETVVAQPDGALLCLQQRRVPVVFGGQSVTLSILTDVGGRQAQQVRALEADRLASMGMLAASIAHEINNPLTYALSNVELSLEGVVGDEDLASQREALRESLEQSKDGLIRVRDIVADLRTFSRGEDHTESAVPVLPVIESVLRMGWGDLRHRARVVRDFGVTPHVDVAPSRLAQVLLNLVMNAAQAILPGRAAENEIRVVTRASSAGGALIEVHDTGPGIRSEERAKIFMPFVTTKRSGTGLGLPIAREIVESQGGVLSVVDRPGGGSIFRVVLPPARLPVSVKPTTGPTPMPERLRILVIDDEPLVARVLGRLLDPHEVTMASSPIEARALLEQSSFDAVFCDLLMPEMTGTELLGAVQVPRKDRLHKRFVFMTGGTEHAVADILSQLSNPVLRKPFDRRSVRAALDLALARSRSSAPPPTTSSPPRTS